MRAPMVDVEEAARRFKAGEAMLLDIREPSELAIVKVEGAMHVPMRQVPGRLKDIPKDRPVLVLCHHGGRSQVVADWLQAQGCRAENVAGGIDAWADVIDQTLAKY